MGSDDLDPIEDLVDNLIEVAGGSAAELAGFLLTVGENAQQYFASGAQPPVAALGHFFVHDPRLSEIRPSLYAAAIQGALTWTPRPAPGVAEAVAFLLRAFSSPEVAMAILRRMNGLAPASPIFAPASPSAGHLIETAALYAGSPAVGARLLDLFRNIRFAKFYAIIFIQIVRLDSRKIPQFIDRMLEFAPTYPVLAGRPSYMLGFDTQLNAVDVENILACLDAAQTRLFAARFLNYTKVFDPTDEGVIELRQEGRADLPRVLVDAPRSPAPPTSLRLRTGGAEVFLNRLASHQAHPDIINRELQKLGVRVQPMFPDQARGAPVHV